MNNSNKITDKRNTHTIRKAELTDIDEIMRIWKNENIRAHGFIPETYWEGNYLAVKSALPNAEIYVYVLDGAIYGFTGLTDNYIEGIFVDEKMQNKGVGTALVNKLKSIKTSLTLSVYEKNTKV